jgi:hypothetical protein
VTTRRISTRPLIAPFAWAPALAAGRATEDTNGTGATEDDAAEAAKVARLQRTKSVEASFIAT